MGAVQSGGGLGKGLDPSSGTQSAKTSTFQSSVKKPSQIT